CRGRPPFSSVFPLTRFPFHHLQVELVFHNARAKKEHVSKEMMEYYHQWCLDEGASFAVLCPFRPGYYVKMGYGYGRKMNKYMFRPGDLPGGSKEGVRFMGTDDVDAMHACFSDYGRGTHGMILKPKSFYERLFRRYKVV
ncbi:MAG: GNAT family N-acetyltransferase, partial [Candidatus Bathyarchaeia archaeon]